MADAFEVVQGGVPFNAKVGIEGSVSRNSRWLATFKWFTSNLKIGYCRNNGAAETSGVRWGNSTSKFA
jgi:hypothetical protein